MYSLQMVKKSLISTILKGIYKMTLGSETFLSRTDRAGLLGRTSPDGSGL